MQVKKNFGKRRTIHTTNASLIIERSKSTIKQSEDWLMSTVIPNVYLRDGISLVNLLCLYSFVLLLPIALLRFRCNSSPNNERSERLLEENENVIMTMSSYVTSILI